MYAVELKEVSRTFPGQERAAITPVAVRFLPGRVTGLVGPDGAGKTTLLRMIAGLLAPTAGRIVMTHEGRELAAAEIKAGLGYMPQRFGLYEDLSVMENLTLAADLRLVDAPTRAARFEKLLAFTNLARFTTRPAGKLSGGMKQKLGLACALIATPRVLLLDEPSVGVDPISRRELWAMVRELAKDGMTVLWSTAYLDEAERCDDVVVMNEGQVLYQGAPGEFSHRCLDRVMLVTPQPQRKRALLKQLAQAPETVDTTIQGDSLRVVLKEPLPEDRVWQLFDDPDSQIRRSAPRFEDAFIDALGGASKEESAIGRVAQLRAERADDLPLIEARELTRRFGDFIATDHVNFQVRQGEVFGLLGPNGAGKSTTFKMLCGLLKPSGGTARVAGIDLTARAVQAKQKLGYMAQKFSLYEGLSVLQNLEFFAGTYGLFGAAARERVRSMMDTFALGAYAETSPREIPLGFKQRLALACALLHEPDILFLDEPTSGVDPLTRREFWTHINAVVERRVTVLVTTHFMEEAEYCDRIGLVSRGQLIALGTPDELKRRAATAECPNPAMEDAFIRLVEEVRS
jgi:ABC-2 type transport system ATP-binding protein